MTVLILGGTTFMGLTLLKALSTQKERDLVAVLVNRGNTYWEDESGKCIKACTDDSTSRTTFHHVKADRKKPEAFAEAILKEL